VAALKRKVKRFLNSTKRVTRHWSLGKDHGIRTSRLSRFEHDPRIGACVDCGHYFSSGEDPIQCVLALGKRVFGVHLKDQVEIGKKSPNVVLGRGHLDVVGLFKALREIKFPVDGALSLEYEANPDNPIDDLKSCLAVVKKAIAKLVHEPE
jgi:sugar phosphate isomerase/epimerase